MNVLGLCAGVGGLELGVHIAEPQSRVVCYVEIDPYCQKVLTARMREGHLDDAPVWDDLRTFDGRVWRGAVDCVAAGFPCQPFSVAGRRLGADDERNLWPDVARVIRDVGPGIVFLENVPAILPYYYHEILPRLQGMGYRTQEGIFSALEVGAPHRRERLFCMAHAEGIRRQQSGRSRQWRTGLANSSPDMADSDESRLQGYGRLIGSAGKQPIAESGFLADAERERRNGARAERPRKAESAGSRGEYPRPSWWATEPALGRVANGIPDRVGQLRALGNGVVPAVAAKAWSVLNARIIRDSEL